MWEWVKENSGALGAIASVLTLLVWGLYFQLLYNNYRRLRRAKILINRGAGETLDAQCIVANMSAEAIYLEAVLVSFGPDDEREESTVCSLSDLDTNTPPGTDPRRDWLQGPLQSGELLDIGTYRSLMEKAEAGGAAITPEGGRMVFSLTVTIVATYMSEDGLVAAERTFDVDRRATRLAPRSFSARQIRSRRDRRAIERLMTREARQRASGRRAEG